MLGAKCHRLWRRFLRLDEQSDTSRRLRFIKRHKRSSWIYVTRKMRYAQMRSPEQNPRRETSAGCICSPFVACGPEAGSQSNSSAAPSTPHTASPAAAANAETLPLEGLKLTDDQKTRIANIRQHVEARREAIIKNEALNQDLKETILQRLNLIETSEILRVLTPDQQKEVQKRIADRRTSEQQEQHQSKPPGTASRATASPTPAAP